jgi:hypothetical protein
MHTKFPDPSKFDSILEGLMDAGYITINRGNGMIYKAKDL